MFTRESSVPIDRPLLLLPHDFLQARGENNRIVKTNLEHREDRHERWATSSSQKKDRSARWGFNAKCKVSSQMFTWAGGTGILT